MLKVKGWKRSHRKGTVGAMVILDWFLLMGVSGLLLWTIVTTLQTKHQERQLQAAFYQLLAEQNGRISLIQLAAAAQVSPITAKQYLQAQAHLFEAELVTDIEGDPFYRFPKLSLPKSSSENLYN